MMGRMKILMSHTRNINMTMSGKKIKYAIPLGTEKGSLGNIKSIEILDDEIILTFDMTPKPTTTEVALTVVQMLPPELGYIKFD
jgi:hypothetical protein